MKKVISKKVKISPEKVSQAVRQLDELVFFDIPWGHNVIILQKIKTTEERLWYAQKTVENSWSRSLYPTLRYIFSLTLKNTQGERVWVQSYRF